MFWTDEGYLLSKNNYDENSIIIDVFTSNHGKYSGIVYGGSSRKQKRNLQIGNKFYLNLISKGENRPGYFNLELLNPVSPLFFDDKKRSICILSAVSILKILLPERQINQKIYQSFENFINEISTKNWIKLYILWELSLIKELGYEIDFFKRANKNNTLESLKYNKKLLMENFILPNKLKFPLCRNILEKYYN